MSRENSEVIWKAVCYLSFVLALAVLIPRSVAAQEKCDDASRANFAAAVASGASDEELEARFGLCREEAASGSIGKSLKAMTAKSKVVTNFNTGYESMNGCGYHPQGEMLACDVELHQFSGYGGFPGGSFEQVRFCMDCDGNGTWDYTTLGFVHVTDSAVPKATPNWYHLAFATSFAAPALCTNNDGGQTNVRAILSWSQTPTDCNFKPYWGDVVDYTARRDP